MKIKDKNSQSYFRIVSGKFKGKKLQIPPPDITRPAKDIVRESIFNQIACRTKENGEALLNKALVLDMFAGSGSMGIESLSRGAEKIYMLEKNPKALKVLEKNKQLLNQHTAIQILNYDFLEIPISREPMDLIFVDPPYFKNLLPPALTVLKEKGWYAQKTLLFAEVDKKEIPTLPDPFFIKKEKIYGRVKIIEIGQ